MKLLYTNNNERSLYLTTIKELTINKIVLLPQQRTLDLNRVKDIKNDLTRLLPNKAIRNI